MFFLGFFYVCDCNLVCGGLEKGIFFIFNRIKVYYWINLVFFSLVCDRFIMVGEEI